MRFPAASSLSKPGRFWRFWWIWCAIIVGVHLLTLVISPTIWQDEVAFIEFGRTLLDPGTRWSINWDPVEQRAVLYPFYLGSLLQELAFRATGGTVAGPRLVSLAGAVCSASLAVAWLRSWPVKPPAALAIGSLFLLEPIYVAGYRGDRIDCWVLSAALASAWLIRTRGNDRKEDVHRPWLIAVAGCLAAVGMATWISFLLLLPLLLWELWNSSAAAKRGRGIALLREIGLFGLWFGIGFGLLQLPVLLTAPAAFSDLRRATAAVVQHPGVWEAIRQLFGSFYRNPLLPVLTIAACLVRCQPSLVVATAAAVAMVASSSIYDHRVVYLLPYLLALIAVPFADPARQASALQITRSAAGGERSGTQHRWLGALLVLCVSSAVAMTLILRPINALSSAESRQPSKVSRVAEEAIGITGAKVLIEPWEFYPSGRRLGWSMYKAFPFFEGFSQEAINQMDFVLLSGRHAPAIDLSNFRPIGTWLANAGKRPVVGGASGYGPYVIYRRMLP